MVFDILTLVTAILIVSVTVLLLCQRFNIPSIVGFLLIGMVAGPFGLGLIRDIELVQILAEGGIILLLFTIGLEFSFEKLLEARRTVLVGGALQVAVTIVVVAASSLVLGLPWGESVFLGFLVSLSSTAIVMKVFQERGEIESLPGRAVLGILIFQDLIIIPMMLVTPFLAGGAAASADTGTLVSMAVYDMLILAVIFVGGRWFVPRVLFHAARRASRELFLFAVAATVFSIAWLTASAGLSLALGAFFAGLIIGESEYNIEALSSILPFRDVLTGLFFVSIGMLLNTVQLLAHPLEILLVVAAIFIIKALACSLSAVVLGLPLRAVVAVGLALSQIGEFSFILAETGLSLGVIEGHMYQVFLASAIITMTATPFLIGAAPRVADILHERAPAALRTRGVEAAAERERRSDHLIVVGFGLTGRSVARAAKVAGIRYTVIESNPSTVKAERGRKVDILYGDATRREVLEHADIENARVLVVVISDRSSIGRVIRAARALNPSIYVIARTRYMAEVSPLIDLGADEVISEEYESSIEIFTRVLGKYFIPHDEIERLIAELRSSGYQMLRRPSDFERSLEDLRLCAPDLAIQTVRVAPGSGAAGKTLADLDLRRSYGVTVLAIRRESDTVAVPGGDVPIGEGDLLVMLASGCSMEAILPLFRPSSPA
ncbi:potassium transporter KefB [Methanoculleus sp. FWC-SCC1]|uniref:Potassium transporter KefB n=1 Tax=Methanoculleus frigidifontis TaxID=2584085 RepID=A0ABT8M717_9EURY|nr:cation:proton antiporter [Methanoculleus sp. FWC-SCC1]MDN7023689.1 potassium transporter KefB [Methanoculleus sp. FWC-SCC1]